MADDIQIKTTPGAQGNPPLSSQGTSSQGGTAGTQDDAAVIDLRVLDQNPPSTPPQPSTDPSAASTASTPTPSSKASGAPKNNAISLGDDDDQFVMSGTQRYAIPSLVKEKFPDLIQLIKETESMNDEEREYWFQILPIMTEDQIKKFRDILVNEKDQLSHLDQEYQTELNKLNEKHMIEWKEFETKEKRKALTAAEQQAQAMEHSEEEALLQRLSQV